MRQKYNFLSKQQNLTKAVGGASRTGKKWEWWKTLSET